MILGCAHATPTTRKKDTTSEQQAMAKRRVIQGLPEPWKVNSNGVVYHWRKKQPISNLLGYLPTVDLGKEYRGPIPTTGCADDCPLCRWNTGKGGREAAAHKGGSTLYPLADVVLHAFDGPPDDRICAPVYLDGKPWKPGNVPNCPIENLRWETLAEAKANTAWLHCQRSMRRHGLHFGRFNYAAVPTLNLQKVS
jgi:hypothetical protein